MDRSLAFMVGLGKGLVIFPKKSCAAKLMILSSVNEQKRSMSDIYAEHESVTYLYLFLACLQFINVLQKASVWLHKISMEG